MIGDMLLIIKGGTCFLSLLYYGFYTNSTQFSNELKHKSVTFIENEEESILIENGTTIMEDEILIIEDSSSDEDYVENENCFVEFEDYNACEDPLDCNSSQEHSKTFNDLHEDTNSLLSRISDSSGTKTKTQQKQTPVLCQICGKTFPRVTLLNDHVASHENNQLFKCKECAKTFGTKQHLKQHTSSHKLHRYFQYNCSVCRKQFKNCSALNEHMNSHTKPYKCEVCGAGYSRKDRRNKHVKLHYAPKTKPSLFLCECGLSYKSRVLLRNHQATDHVKKNLPKI